MVGLGSKRTSNTSPPTLPKPSWSPNHIGLYAAIAGHVSDSGVWFMEPLDPCVSLRCDASHQQGPDNHNKSKDDGILWRAQSRTR